LTEDGKTGEVDEADSSAFRQFGREEAFGGHGSRASAQEETEEGGRKMLTEEEFRTEVADRLGSIVVDAARFARAAELQNFLLQRLVVALEGNGTAYSTLLSEDEADGSYKTDVSEEGSEEESGEESGEESEE